MEYMSFNRLFIAVSLICIFVIQRLVCLAHQATPLNLIKPVHDDINMENLAFVNHLQFIRSNYYKDDNNNNNDINNHNNNILSEIHHHHHHQHQQQHQHHHPHHNHRNLYHQQHHYHHHQNDHDHDHEHENEHEHEHEQTSSSSLSSEPSPVHLSYFPMSVLSFELNERQGCLEANNYSVIETFSAINKGEIVLKIRGFKIDLVLNSGATSGGSSFLKQDNKNEDSALHHHKNSATRETINYNNINDHKRQQQPLQNECHGHGFSIYDCEPFDIEPQHERRIRVGFSPDFTLTKYVAYLTLLTNLDFEYTIKLKASVPLPLVAACNQSLPRPDWEPTLRYIFPLGIMILIIVAILMAYMKALNVKGQRVSANSQSFNSQTNSHGNHHNGGSKDYDRSNNNNNQHHMNDSFHKDHRGISNGHGTTTPISAPLLAHNQNNNNSSSSSTFNGLSPANGRNNSINNNNNNNSKSNNNKATNNNNCNQKRRKNSSSVNSEKVPNNNINNNSNKDNNNNKSFATSSSPSSSSSSSTTSSSSSSTNQNNNDKRLSSPYAPIFQNLTNVIASPPPPLPTFENDFDPLEFKKLRNKKSAKKSNSLNGSIASNDDVGNSLCSSTNHMTSSLTYPSSSSTSNSGSISSSASTTSSSSAQSKSSNNNNLRNSGKFSNIIKANLTSGCNNSSFNGEMVRDRDLIQATATTTTPLRDVFNNTNNQLAHKQHQQMDQLNRKGSLRDVFNNAASLSDDDQETCQDFVRDANKLYTKKSSSSLLSSKYINSKTKSSQFHHQSSFTSTSHASQFVTNGISSLVTGKVNGVAAVASVTPIQPPSSLSSTPSSSVPSATSSTSSSPPLSATSYGEYSLLGPGATFELPCLRVRSAQINSLTQLEHE